MKPTAPGSATLDAAPRSRLAAALDRACDALAELLVIVELADDDDGGVPVARHEAAKRDARRALADIRTLRGQR